MQEIAQLIDEKIKEIGDSQPNRDYLGASTLGRECLRQLFFEYNHVPKDEGKDFTARTFRIFQRGNVGEDMVAGWLRDAGFELSTIDPQTGEQYRFQLEGYPISGGCDGIITYSPISEIPTPCLWESKQLGAKSWNWLKDKGLRKGKWEYLVQMQVYMKMFALTDNPGLFTAVNSDTMEIFYQLVEYDERVAVDAIERGKRVVDAQFFEELPKPKDAPECFSCRYCSYVNTCSPDIT